ncbi:hypothetical protein TNCV_2745051 [Trichonephila clavipes]|nr:hypothetical protein TNCV_2745051 [Trichonephila clavipes]
MTRRPRVRYLDHYSKQLSDGGSYGVMALKAALWHHELVSLKICGVARLMRVEPIKAQSFQVGGVWKLQEWVPAQVSSSSFECGSKFRGPSPKTAVLLHSI